MNLSRVVEKIRKRFTNGGAILLYHRVTSLERDPQLLSVSPQNFADHVEVLKRHVNVVPLREMTARVSAGLRARTVAITFDDGYADNLLEAYPVLERNGIPATVFVTSGFVGSDRELWWDELDRVLLESADADWDVTQVTDSSERQKSYRHWAAVLQRASEAERSATLARLRLLASCEPRGRSSHRALTAAEVRQLAATGLVEIGAHTVSHPVLAALTHTEQHAEITEAKAALEAIVGKPVESFAYPYGTKSDYTKESVAAVRNAGFRLACSNFDGLVWPGTNVHELPRILIRDWGGEKFARILDEAFA